MKYKNFDEWFDEQKYNLPFAIDVKAYMREAWDAAVIPENEQNKLIVNDIINDVFPKNIILGHLRKFERLSVALDQGLFRIIVKNEQKATIGEQIKELLTTLNDAEKIDCTCDKIKIKSGAWPCICVRGGVIKQAGAELGQYLRKLRKELK